MTSDERGTFDPPTTGGAIHGLQVVRGFRFTDVVHHHSRHLAEHCHDRASISLIVRGRYPETYASNESREFPAGSLIYKPPNHPHSNRFSGQYARLLVIELEPSRFDAMSEADASLAKRWQVYDPNLSAIAQRLYYELLDADRDSNTVVESLSYELLDAASRVALRQAACRPPTWLKPVMEFLHAEFPNSPTIEELARVAGVSPTRFSRGFRRATGRTPGEFIRGRRVAMVLERLVRGCDSGSEIAAEAGFADESHMIRTVRRAILGTPGSFRRRVRANPVLFSKPTPAYHAGTVTEAASHH